MKKVALALIVLGLVLCESSTGNAQYQKGKNFLGPHVGLSGIGSTFTIGGDYEYGVTENVGVGGLVDYWSYSFGDFGFTDWKYTYITIGATGSYHFLIPGESKWDPFAGLALGYYIVSVSTPNYTGPATYDASRLFIGIQGGVRYFFTPNIAAQARAGFGAYILAVGVDFKF